MSITLESVVSRESFARKFVPAGFKEPGHEPREYKGAKESELAKRFYSWLGQLPANPMQAVEIHYQSAIESIKDLGEIHPEEANSLLIGLKPKNQNERYAGLFISACYTKSPEKIIIFDVEAPNIDYIGYKLPKNFVLINNIETGNWFAENSSNILVINNGKTGGCFVHFSSGTVINNGEIGDYSAIHSSGFVINNGKTGVNFAWESSGAAINNGKTEDDFAASSCNVVIAVKEPKSYGDLRKAKKVLMPEDCTKIPELQEYFNSFRNLKATDAASARQLLERLGENPVDRIKQDILRILADRGGYKGV